MKEEQKTFEIGDLVRMNRSLVPYGPYSGQIRIGIVVQINESKPLYTRYYVHWNSGANYPYAMWYAGIHLEKVE